jgi:GNAT superfamily N-acetyltransferase
MSNRIEVGNITIRKAAGLPEVVVYEMKFLDGDNLDDMTRLQGIMADCLMDKEIFRLTTTEEFRELLSQRKAVIGVLAEGRLIAYNIVSFPGRDGDNFGADINLPQEELVNVAHLKAVVVHPDYRGNQLQKRMFRVHLEFFRELGYKHICSTVSPKNAISVDNHFANGFVIRGLKVKYGDRLRYIMHKNIVCPFVSGPESIGIISTDIEGQKELIDKGFSGFKMHKQNDCWVIIYAQAKR